MVPMPDRVFTASESFADDGDSADHRGRAVEVLTAPALAHIVELVAYVEAGQVVVANARGACSFPLNDPAAPVQVRHGADPLERQDPLALTPLLAELADLHPGPLTQSYPFAAARLASVFADADRSPDLVVVHTDAHHWPERGGHLGEHGSLGVLQSRAPFLLSGTGVVTRGLLADAARTVDVGPTLAALAGVPLAELAGLEGRARLDLVGPGAAHVVGLLWDGANANALLAGARSGALPNVARLLSRGCALLGGAIAEFPSVTLVNHTSALTGVGPGRHGIVHNAFYDRGLAAQVLANDRSTWHSACSLLRPGVTTIWEWLAAARPDAPSACVNEPVDRGAGYSTMAIIRASGSRDGARGMNDRLPPAEEDPYASQDEVAADPDFAWSTSVDGLGLAQMLTLWSDSTGSPPALTWWNTTLTDTAHHVGGPHSAIATAGLRDSDARLGVWLDLVAERGLLDDTVILLTADHGMAGAVPGCTGDWDEELRAAGIPFRDEAYGFLYFGV